MGWTVFIILLLHYYGGEHTREEIQGVYVYSSMTTHERHMVKIVLYFVCTNVYKWKYVVNSIALLLLFPYTTTVYRWLSSSSLTRKLDNAPAKISPCFGEQMTVDRFLVCIMNEHNPVSQRQNRKGGKAVVGKMDT